MSSKAGIMRLAVLQLKVAKDILTNVQNATKKIEEAVCVHKPKLVVLPECFNTVIPQHSERVPDGYTSQQLSKLAKQFGIYIVGGSIYELGDNDATYNTCTIWNPNGDLLAKHRKMHLFDVDVKGVLRFKESDFVTAGNDFTMIDVDDHKIGIGICYDIQFEEMARIYRSAGCKMLIYPASFNVAAGPLYWELLQRSRACDNQLFVVTASPARDDEAKYVPFGHSMIVDPWAKVLKSAGEGEETVIADIDFTLVDQVRQQIPIFSQRRTDLYSNEKISN